MGDVIEDPLGLADVEGCGRHLLGVPLVGKSAGSLVQRLYVD